MTHFSFKREKRKKEISFDDNPKKIRKNSTFGSISINFERKTKCMHAEDEDDSVWVIKCTHTIHTRERERAPNNIFIQIATAFLFLL